MYLLYFMGSYLVPVSTGVNPRPGQITSSLIGKYPGHFARTRKFRKILYLIIYIFNFSLCLRNISNKQNNKPQVFDFDIHLCYNSFKIIKRTETKPTKIIFFSKEEIHLFPNLQISKWG